MGCIYRYRGAKQRGLGEKLEKIETEIKEWKEKDIKDGDITEADRARTIEVKSSEAEELREEIRQIEEFFKSAEADGNADECYTYSSLVKTFIKNPVESGFYDLLFSLGEGARQERIKNVIEEKRLEMSVRVTEKSKYDLDPTYGSEAKEVISARDLLDDVIVQDAMDESGVKLYQMDTNEWINELHEKYVLRDRIMTEQEFTNWISTQLERYDMIAADAKDLHGMLTATESDNPDVWGKRTKGTVFKTISGKVSDANKAARRYVAVRSGRNKLPGHEGEGCVFETNVNMVGKLRMNGADVAAHFDFLVIDEDGRVHVYNIRTSTEPASRWSWQKMEKYRYEMAVQKRILEYNGIDMKNAEMNIIPVRIKYDESFTEVTDIDVQPPQAIDMVQGKYIFERYDAFARKIMDSTTDTESVSAASIIEANEDLKLMFPVQKVNVKADGIRMSAEEWTKRNWHNCDPQRTSDGGWRLKLPDSDEAVVVRDKNTGSANAEFVAIVAERIAQGHEAFDGMYSAWYTANDIRESYERNGFMSSRCKNDKVANFLNTLLKPYFEHEIEDNEDGTRTFNYEWEMLSNAALEAANIILFKNRRTDQIDVFCFTQTNPSVRVDLGYERKNIMAPYMSDMDNGRPAIENRYADIEAMRVMTFLNHAITEIDGTKKLGKLYVMSLNGLGETKGEPYDFSHLLEDFDKVVKIVNSKSGSSRKLVNNFKAGNIGTVGWDEVLYQMLADICDKPYAEASRADLKSIRESIESGVDVFGNAKPGLVNADSISVKLSMLRGLKSRLYELAKSEFDPADAVNVVKLSYAGSGYLSDLAKIIVAVNKAIAVYSGTDVVSVRDLNVVMSKIPKPGDYTEENVNQVADMVKETQAKISSRVLEKYNLKVSKIFTRYYEKAGFSHARKVIIGDTSRVYKNLFQYDSNGRNTFNLKNPFDMSNDLMPYEREFLRDILYEFYCVRQMMLGREIKFSSASDPRIAREMPEGYLWLPLEKASAGTKHTALGKFLKEKGNMVVETVKHPLESIDKAFESVRKVGEEETTETFFESMTTHSRFWSSMNDYDSRMVLYDEKGSDYFETNIENVYIDFLYNQVKCEENNNLMMTVNAIEFMLALKGYEEGGKSKSVDKALDLIRRYTRANVEGKEVMDKTGRQIKEVLKGLRKLVGLSYISNNPYGYTRDKIMGFATILARTVSKNMTDISVKDFVNAYMYVAWDSMKEMAKVSFLDELNMRYRVSNFDDANAAVVLKTNGGVMDPMTWAYWSMRRPDFFNKITILVATMMHDGTFEAYVRDENGHLKYDWRKDKRFDALAKGDRSDKRYMKQLETYNNLMERIMKEQPELGLKITDDLPDAYSLADINRIKQLGENSFGAYDQASKNMLSTHAIGWVYGNFFTWLNGVFDDYFSGTRRSNKKPVAVQRTNDKGEKLYWDKDGNIVTQDTGARVMDYVPGYVQGVFATLGDFLREMTHGSTLKQYRENYMTNPMVRENYRRLMTDMLMSAIFITLMTSVIKPAYKKRKREMDPDKLIENITAEVLYKGFARSYDIFSGPLAIVKYFGDSTTPVTYDLGSKMVTDTFKVIAGKEGFGKTVMSYNAFYRSMQDSLSNYWKANFGKSENKEK